MSAALSQPWWRRSYWHILQRPGRDLVERAADDGLALLQAAVQDAAMDDSRYFCRPAWVKRRSRVAADVGIDPSTLHRSGEGEFTYKQTTLFYEVARVLEVPPAAFLPDEIQYVAAAARVLVSPFTRYRQLKEEGLSPKKIAEKVHKSISYVNEVLNLAESINGDKLDEEASVAYAAYMIMAVEEPVLHRAAPEEKLLLAAHAILRSMKRVNCWFSDAQTRYLLAVGCSLKRSDCDFPFCSLDDTERYITRAAAVLDPILVEVCKPKSEAR